MVEMNGHGNGTPFERNEQMTLVRPGVRSVSASGAFLSSSVRPLEGNLWRGACEWSGSAHAPRPA